VANQVCLRLHPALTRPGRCLAQVEFAAFTLIAGAAGPAVEMVREVVEWRGDDRPAPRCPLTLAELYGDDDSVSTLDDRRPPPHRRPPPNIRTRRRCLVPDARRDLADVSPTLA